VKRRHGPSIRLGNRNRASVKDDSWLDRTETTAAAYCVGTEEWRPDKRMGRTFDLERGYTWPATPGRPIDTGMAGRGMTLNKCTKRSGTGKIEGRDAGWYWVCAPSKDGGWFVPFVAEYSGTKWLVRETIPGVVVLSDRLSPPEGKFQEIMAGKIPVGGIERP